MPELSIAWAHNLIDPAVTLKEQFVAAENASFRIEGEEPPEDFLLFGAGLSFHPNASDGVFVRYNGAWPRMFRPTRSAPAARSAGKAHPSRFFLMGRNAMTRHAGAVGGEPKQDCAIFGRFDGFSSRIDRRKWADGRSSGARVVGCANGGGWSAAMSARS